VEVESLQEKNKLLTMEMVQLTSVLRSSEKTIEQQIETAESLEKTRDYQMRILAENAETVIVLHCDTFF